MRISFADDIIIEQPSHSNPSDDPSRGSFSALTALGSVKIDIPWGELLPSLPARQKPHFGKGNCVREFIRD